jgi:FlaA1/EpsC-like NDP-sugar epimerase
MHRLTLLVVDLVLLSLATAAALLLRDNLEVSPTRFRDLLPYLTITLAVGAGVLSVMGLNRAVWRLSAMPDYLRIMAAMVSTVILSVAIAFIGFRLDGIARSLPILQCILGTCLLVGSRVAARLHYTMRRRAETARPFSGYAAEGLENVLLVGLNPIAELYLEAAVQFPESRVRVVGLLGRGERHTGGDYPVDKPNVNVYIPYQSAGYGAASCPFSASRTFMTKKRPSQSWKASSGRTAPSARTAAAKSASMCSRA